MRARAIVLGLAALAAASLAATAAAAAPTRAMTATNDARACTPLDKGGFAFATGGGLVITRPDGSSVTLTSLDGLPETRVHAVAQQGDALWVGTEGGAARVTLDGTPRVARTVGRSPVHAIAIDGATTYLGTWGAGVFRAAEGGTAERVPSAATGVRVAALAIHEGALFAAFADGPLAKLDGGSLREIRGSAPHGQSLASIPTDTGARLVYGALEGLYRFGPDAQPSQISSVDARGVAASGGALLVASYGAGVLVGSPRGALRADTSLGRFVQGVGARGAARCVATTDGAFVDAGRGTFTRVAMDGPPSNDVTAIAANGDRVVVGTFDHGAAIARGGRFERLAAVTATETVNAIAWDGQGDAARLWLGTAHGLVRVDPGGATRRFSSHDGLPSSLVRSLLVLPDGKVVAGTEEGAAIVDGERVRPILATKKGAPRDLASPMHATWAIARGEDGTLFLGTATGLYWGKDAKWSRAALATGELEDDWVTALAVSGSDVWVGTYSKGVTRMRFGAARPTVARLGGGYVNPDGLTVAGGRVLAATMDGLLSRSATDDAAGWELTRGVATGRDVTAARAVNGSLWVASRRGIAVSTE